MFQIKKVVVLILLISIMLFIGVVSASEHITNSTNIENTNLIDTPSTENVDVKNTEDIIQNNSDSDEILTSTIENNEIKYFNKKSTIVTGYSHTVDVSLSETTPSFPSIKVSIKELGGNVVREGQVQFEINGQKYTSNVDYSGEAYLNGDKIFKDLGTFTIKAKYLGTLNFESSSTTLKYIINGKTTINVDDITVNNGQQIVIKPIVTPRFNSIYKPGNIKLNINGNIYILNSTNPSLRLQLKTGTYSCTAEYGFNQYFVKSSDSFKIIVIEEPLIVAQDYYITTVGEKYNLNVYVVNSNGNPITGGILYLNEDYAPVKNGYAQFTLNPQDIAFDYYSVRYKPNVKHYKEVFIEDAFPVATFSSTKLSINQLNTIAGTTINNVQFSITDNLNRRISPSGYFLINGKKYNSLQDFKTPKQAGTFTYDVQFVPDLILYGNSTAILKIVNKFKTTVKVKSVSGYENKNVKIKAKIKDHFGKKVKKGTITFKIKGKTYTAKIKNGKAVKKIKIPKPSSRAIFYHYHYKNGKEFQTAKYVPKTYKCSVIYKGNNKYIKSSSKFKVTSKKKSKTKEYHTPYNPPSKSSSSKTTPNKKTTKKTKIKTSNTQSYGYYPTYHKSIPKLDVNLFKKKPAINPNVKLSDIVIITE